MKIEHIALYTSDLEHTKAFFEKYFNGKAASLYHNKTTDFKSYFITFEDGARLEIMTRPELEQTEKSQFQSGYIHIAFTVGSKENVDSITETLRNDGYEVISGPRTTGDGYYESAVLGPENNIIEITV